MITWLRCGSQLLDYGAISLSIPGLPSPENHRPAFSARLVFSSPRYAAFRRQPGHPELPCSTYTSCVMSALINPYDVPAPGLPGPVPKLSQACQRRPPSRSQSLGDSPRNLFDDAFCWRKRVIKRAIVPLQFHCRTRNRQELDSYRRGLCRRYCWFSAGEACACGELAKSFLFGPICPGAGPRSEVRPHGLVCDTPGFSVVLLNCESWWSSEAGRPV